MVVPSEHKSVQPAVHPERLDVGRFRLVAPLAAGGMGVVWTATTQDDLEHPDVAIKLMRGDRAAEQKQREIFTNEARITARLNHRNIVRALDHGVLPAGQWPDPLTEGCPWLAMQRAPGGTLVERVGRMAWHESRKVLLELLDALGYLHDQGLLHLDVKPGNVLIGGDGEGLLADFGLARPIDVGEGSGSLDWGTAAYMAPEQLSEDLPRIGPATDLYGLGCVAWALLSGRPPFGRAPEEAAVQHLYSPVPNLVTESPVPQETEVWLRRLLSKDARDRYTDARTAAVALLALGEAPIEPQTGHPRRRSVSAEPTTRVLNNAQRAKRAPSEPRKRVPR